MGILNSNPQLAFTTSTFILLLLSILAVILHTSVLISTAWGSLAVTETLHFGHKDFGIYVLPEHLDASSSKLALVSSIISLVTSTDCLAFSTGYWTKNKQTYQFSPISILRLTLLFNTLLCFVAVTYLHISYIRSATYNPERSHRGHYHEGTFDVEAWTCQVVRYSDVYSDSMCRDARAGRVVQVLIFVVALVAMWVGRWELREGGGLEGGAAWFG
ncbi:uncharacterized protein EAE97_007481 [Botrytis byssoidea]|uniref:Uncharacterized protein n=1 Tax=Botrytis byssoidea TaxID=139641 RepID=A0A9P5M596_9HELO|nr:uncharacterized protein EAE97_007481 [Botrytis byssoidea]KAF7939401.1 hypothetical protein EAE97_007481 [Botrytis byssoidea]